MDSGRIYPHFCVMARALEEVGERWSLLIVRDLTLGPRRFSDLARSVGGITPTRLTDRLRSLEATGIVVREPGTGGREVWYRLTEAGLDLRPAVEALAFWGIDHAFDPPFPGESVHPDHVMLPTKVWLGRRGTHPRSPVVWAWRLGDHDRYTLSFDGSKWDLVRGSEAATVTIVATSKAWARFLTAPAEARRLPTDGIELIAPPAAAKAFARAFRADLNPGALTRP